MNRLGMHHRLKVSPPVHSIRGGFTLVEMLVSTALVLLIMVLFAQIYGAAVGTLREQEGIAKNDAKARSVVTMLRNDLSVRSYREIPLAVSDPLRADVVARGIVPIHPRCLEVNNAQKGFFYISENDPGNDSDDLLSFTMFLPQERGHFTGRVQKDTTGRINHPDSDDSVVNDGVTASRAAVVTYYMQEGKLHRRINLLRDPLVIPNPYDAGDAGAGALTWLPVQPSNETAADQIGLGNVIFTTFTNWYDDNALAVTQNPPPAFSTATTRRLLSVKSLENTHRLTNAPVALPLFREGHVAPSGNPEDEYDSGAFVGRRRLTGNREGEDVVLSGVVGFDVKVWEPLDANANNQEDSFEGPFRRGRFVDIGHGPLRRPDDTPETNETGPFRFDTSAPGNATWGKRNTSYSNGDVGRTRVFDTWHPMRPTGEFPDLPPAALNADAVPPYYPLKVAPTASNTTWNVNVAKSLDTTDWTQSSIFFPWGSQGDFSIGFRATNNANTGTRLPVWSRIPGDKVKDGNVIWECFDNRIGLSAMRITIRFIDPGSNLIRQVTLDHSFLD